MSSDEQRGKEFVDNIFETWKFRYVSNGIQYYDLLQLWENIGSWQEWCGEFSRVGEKHESLGDAALEDEKYESAAIHFVQSAKYYHFGSHVWHEDKDERERAHRKAIELHRRGGESLDPPVTRLEVPCSVSGTEIELYGNLRVPDAAGTDAPLVLLYPGLDSTKEEMSTYEPYLLDRGMATLAIEGPGQGESWYNHRMTHEYHHAISGVVDYLEEQQFPGVDTSRLGGLGQSLGGFYAPYVAAQDDRFDACVGFSGPFSVGPVSSWQFQIAIDQFKHACRTDSLVEVDEITEQMSLRDVVDDLTIPALMITGAKDTIVPAAQTQRIAERAPEGEYLVFEDGLHNGINLDYECRPYAADWLQSRL